MLIAVTPNSAEWERLRYEGIGASEAGNIWGVGFDDILVMAAHKRNKTNKVASFKMRYGHWAEDGICNYTRDRLSRSNYLHLLTYPCEGIYACDYADYIRSTPDRLGSYIDNDNIIRHFVLDSKNSGAGMYWSFKKKPQLKMSYWIQAQQQMLTTEQQEAFMAINFANERFVIWHINRCDEFLEYHTELCKRTWAAIQAPTAEECNSMLEANVRATVNILTSDNWLEDFYKATCAIISDED
jgi:predicted phage-related endonuclease